MISIAIYDDNKNRRDSLKTLLEFTPEMHCVGLYENCDLILQNTELNKPDLILMDIEMPGTDGITGVSMLKKSNPSIKIIMQTAFDDEEKVFAAIKAGAEGYLLKSASAQQIIQSIQEVMAGGASMSPSIALKVIRFFNHQSNDKTEYNLTPKESEVLKLLADGNSYKMIANQLGSSYYTVNNHIKKIYDKLHVHSLGEAVALAHKERLI